MRRALARAASRLREVTGADAEPNRLAASWAAGIAIGLSPLIGAQTVLAIVTALCLRLNKVDVLLGTLVVNPWTLTFYFPASVLLGGLIRGAPHVGGLPQARALLDFSVWQDPEPLFRSLLISWAFGATAFALLGGAVSFFVIRYLASHRGAPINPSQG